MAALEHAVSGVKRPSTRTLVNRAPRRAASTRAHSTNLTRIWFAYSLGLRKYPENQKPIYRERTKVMRNVLGRAVVASLVLGLVFAAAMSTIAQAPAYRAPRTA